MVTLLSCVFWTSSWMPISQQFHHLSWRNCYSSKSNKGFIQSSQTLRKLLIFDPSVWVCVLFCTVLQWACTRPRTKLSVKCGNSYFIYGKSWISEVFLVLHLQDINLFYSTFLPLFHWVKSSTTASYIVTCTVVDWPSFSFLAGREPSCCDPTSLLWSKNSVKALGEGGDMKYEWIQLCFDGYVSKYPSKRLLKARKSVCVVEIGSSSLVSLPASSWVAFHFIF